MSAATGEPHGDDVFWRNRGWWKRVGRTSAATWLSTALAFVATVVVARTLGPTQFGSVVLAVSVAALIASLLDLTLEDAVVHHGFRALRGGHIGALRRLVRTSLSLDILIGLAVAAAIVAAASPLADLISGGRLDPDLLRVAALVVLVNTVDGTTGALLLLVDRPDLRAWILAGTNLARLAGVALVLALGGGALAVVGAYVVAGALGSVVQAALAWRLAWVRWRALHDTPGGTVRTGVVTKFAVHTSLAKTVFSGRDLMIPVVLGSLAGPAAVGLFRISLLPVVAVGLISGPIRMLLLPEQNKLHAAQRFTDLWRSVRAHTIAGLAVGVPGAVVGWFALDWLIPALYSSTYDGAVDAARILLVAAVLHLTFSWWKTMPAALGRPELGTRIASVSLVVMIGLLAAFAGRGDEGAALAYSLETVLVGVPMLFYVRHLLLRDAEREPPTREPAPRVAVSA